MTVGAQTLAAETNYVFNYPYASTPCFLLNLARPATTRAELARQDGVRYAWQGSSESQTRALKAFREAFPPDYSPSAHWAADCSPSVRRVFEIPMSRC